MVVDGAPDLVAQMLDKLVANAVEFGEDGAIEVSLAREGGEALLSVGNDGPPLPEMQAGHLFDSMMSVREVAATPANRTWAWDFTSCGSSPYSTAAAPVPRTGRDGTGRGHHRGDAGGVLTRSYHCAGACPAPAP